MENNTAVLIAIVSAIATLTGGGYAAWVQLKRDKAAGNVELIRLQDEIETALWARTKAEFADMRARLDRQDATIQEQGALIMQLRERVKSLEYENGILKAENEQLKGNKTGKRI